MCAECLNGIMGTGRVKAAALREQWRKGLLVEFDQQDQESCGETAFVSVTFSLRTPAAARSVSSSFITSN